ncbi:MAG: hypothetical protein WD708_06695 [Kiritimatiellia bacterium]
MMFEKNIDSRKAAKNAKTGENNLFSEFWRSYDQRAASQEPSMISPRTQFEIRKWQNESQFQLHPEGGAFTAAHGPRVSVRHGRYPRNETGIL